jgi:hypothetical protein
MEAASLRTQNPHAKPADPAGIHHSSERCTEMGESSVVERWVHCRGEAVADDSKHLLAVTHCGREYIMADIRFLSQSEDKSSLIFEFFFDGDCGTVRDSCPDGFLHFLTSIQSRVSDGIKEAFRRRLRSALGDKKAMKKFSELQFPGTDVSYVGQSLDDAFRDAGCMLSFVAVRISMSPDCALTLGSIVFPELFGVKSHASPSDPPMPKWLVGMGFVTAIFAVATTYAWANILIYGNSFS